MPDVDEDHPIQEGYTWDHSVGELLGALIGAGLRLEYFHEHPMAARAKFPFMQPRG